MTEPARPGRRRPSANEVEEWAFGLLERHLVDTKHVVANVRRPDRTNRTSRDVDFLVEVDGRDIAIEVTQLDQARDWWNLVDRLEAAVRARLDSNPPDEGPAWLMLSLNLTRKGSYREVDVAAAQIAEAVCGAPPDIGMGSWQPLRDLPEPALSLAEVEIRRVPSAERRLSFVNGNEAHGPWIEPRALAFVRHLIASKGSQAAGYEEVWILVVDNEVIIDLDNLREALTQEGVTVPSNWARLIFIPATDRTAIQTLELNPGAAGTAG